MKTKSTKYKTVKKLRDALGNEYARICQNRETGEVVTFTKNWTDGQN